MDHETLGTIVRENSDGIARLSYEDRELVVRIIADEIPFEATLEFAASVARDRPVLTRKPSASRPRNCAYRSISLPA